MKLPLVKINAIKEKLYAHPLLNDGIIHDLDTLQVFMQHHVYAVWDFMSLLKSLQHHVCPSTNCWVPNKWMRAGAARLINEIVLGEESDIDLDGNGTITHHDLYCQAMLEIGADPRVFEAFIEHVRYNGFHAAIDTVGVPYPSDRFMRKTFEYIDTGEPHIIAAAFCFGRETIIPDMFTKIVKELEVTRQDAPKFHYYLDRHIEMDGDEHGPASIQLIETLCEHDPVKIHEAEQAAISSIRARIELWDDVQSFIQQGDYKTLRGDLFDN
jgi:hypothetical protein